MARNAYERGRHRLGESADEYRERQETLKNNLVAQVSRMEIEARALIRKLYPVQEDTPLIHQVNLERAVRNRERSMLHAQYKLRALKDARVS